MIARKHRFHGYGSLRYVYQHGRTVRGPLSSLKFVVNPRREEYRLAVVVSRKVHKSAVTRNRIRRRLYEACRRHELEITTPYDMVLTVFHEQIAHIPPKDLEKLVKDHLTTAEIIHTSKETH
jgi:ribonuclease P protein component